MSTTLTSVSKKLLDHLPTPIAIHWGLLHRATSDSERMRQSWAVLDSFLRYSAGILLANYLRSPEIKPHVEDIIAKMERPSLGHYCGLIREILRENNSTDVFFSHLYEWYYTPKGKPTADAKLLVSLITKRNHDAHGVVRTEIELKEEVRTILFELQTLLHNAKWLSGYTLFQVSNTQPQRRGGQRGSLLMHVGDNTNPLPKPCQWSCILFEESMYLSHPSGEQFLEVTPFIMTENNGRSLDLYLWVSTPKGKRVDLRCAATSNVIKKLPLLLEESVSWSIWLERRGELDPIFDNNQIADFVAEDFQEIGMLIGDRYRVLERLGEGGMGLVYLVQDELLDEQVALKVLHLEQVDSTERERTKAEFRFMKSLQHPHILPVNSLDILNDGRVTISMPLMEGTLKDLVGSDKMNEANLQTWATHVLSALDFLHKRQPPIFHRDIKPSNMLIDNDGLVYISDFGIARQDGDVRITRTAEQMGSLPYMAPELLLGQDAGPASDRFALGVSLHEMLTGKLPKKTKVGQDIDGDFGEFIRQLGSEDGSVRLNAQWPPAKPVEEHEEQPSVDETPPLMDAEPVEDTPDEVKPHLESTSITQPVEPTSHSEPDEPQPLIDEANIDTAVESVQESITESTPESAPEPPAEPLQSESSDSPSTSPETTQGGSMKWVALGLLAVGGVAATVLSGPSENSESSLPPISAEELEANRSDIEKWTDKFQQYNIAIPDPKDSNSVLLAVTDATYLECAAEYDLNILAIQNCQEQVFVNKGDLPAGFKSTPEELNRGQELFVQHCESCHGYMGTGRTKQYEPVKEWAPSIQMIDNKDDGTAVIGEHGSGIVKSETEQFLIIRYGRGKMPANKNLTASEYVSLIRHIKSSTGQLIDFNYPDEEVLSGEEYLTIGGCTGCHSTDGSSGTGPTFKGLYGSKVRAGFAKRSTADEPYLKNAILKHKMPANVHKALARTPDQQNVAVKKIVEYIKSLEQ